MEASARPHRSSAIASLVCSVLVPILFAVFVLMARAPGWQTGHSGLGSLIWFLALTLVAIISLVASLCLALIAVFRKDRSARLSIVAIAVSGLTIVVAIVYVLNALTINLHPLY